MIELIIRPWKLLIGRVKLHIKQWTRPATTGFASGILSDTTRSRADLIAENALLRQQLIVLRRQGKRPQLTRGDRVCLVLLARCTRFWQQALHIVQPNTSLRWHRDLFRRYWRRRSRTNDRRSRIAPETIALIRRVVKENLLWGAESTRGELLELGIKASMRETQKDVPKGCRQSGQSGYLFLKLPLESADRRVAHFIVHQ